MADDIKDVLLNIYENLFLKDIVFIVSGAMVLGSLCYAFTGNLINFINFITQNLLKFILFLGTAYLTGLILNDGVNRLSFLRLFMSEKLDNEPYLFIPLIAKIREKWGQTATLRIERCIYFRNISKAISSASLLSALILIYPIIAHKKMGEIIAFIVLILCVFIGRAEHKDCHIGIKEDLSHFFDLLMKDNGKPTDKI